MRERMSGQTVSEPIGSPVNTGKGIAARLALHLPLSALVCALASRTMPGVTFARVWALYAIVAGVTIAFEHYRHRQEQRIATADLERRVTESRLDALRTQLHPHFLFNALNTISAHLEQDPRTARWMLEQLGSLLRMSLEYAREQETSLERELAFIECYVELQKVRFEDRIDVITNIAPDVRGALVPSLILQPLVENAIRHGLASDAVDGQIEIRAWRERESLRLSVHDDGPGLPADWDPERGFGVGLSNTRERLHRLYGDGQRFEIAGHPGAGVRVALTLPFRQREPIVDEVAAGAGTGAGSGSAEKPGEPGGEGR
jgi:LytS/YehU family sensor histidine kinase